MKKLKTLSVKTKLSPEMIKEIFVAEILLERHHEESELETINLSSKQDGLEMLEGIAKDLKVSLGAVVCAFIRVSINPKKKESSNGKKKKKKE